MINYFSENRQSAERGKKKKKKKKMRERLEGMWCCRMCTEVGLQDLYIDIARVGGSRVVEIGLFDNTFRFGTCSSEKVGGRKLKTSFSGNTGEQLRIDIELVSTSQWKHEWTCKAIVTRSSSPTSSNDEHDSVIAAATSSRLKSCYELEDIHITRDDLPSIIWTQAGGGLALSPKWSVSEFDCPISEIYLTSTNTIRITAKDGTLSSHAVKFRTDFRLSFAYSGITFCITFDGTDTALLKGHDKGECNGLMSPTFDKTPSSIRILTAVKLSKTDLQPHPPTRNMLAGAPPKYLTGRHPRAYQIDSLGGKLITGNGKSHHVLGKPRKRPPKVPKLTSVQRKHILLEEGFAVPSAGCGPGIPDLFCGTNNAVVDTSISSLVLGRTLYPMSGSELPKVVRNIKKVNGRRFA